MLTALLASFAPLAGVALVSSPAAAEERPLADAAGPAEVDPSVEVVVDRGAGLPALYLPVDEELVFEAKVQLGVLSATVGQVAMTARREPYRAPLLGGRGKTGGDTYVLSLTAKGQHALYSLDSDIVVRRQPLAWPSTVWRYNHRGTEQRRRELLIGQQGGEWKARYRSDTEEGAPKGTRIWGPPDVRAIPAGTLDMASAIYLARTLVRDDLEQLEFTQLDKLRLWDVVVTRGAEQAVETPVGTFNAQELILETRRNASDTDPDRDGFVGPFGLKGTIHLWVERTTGVPVLIEGDMPAGPFEIRVDVRLQRHSGTPKGFVPR